MIRALAIGALAVLAAGCAFDPEDVTPTSPEQWQRRQERIERREAERVRLCAIMNKDSERYARDCKRSGDAD